MSRQIFSEQSKRMVAGLRDHRLAFAIPEYEFVEGNFHCYVCGIVQRAAGKHLESKAHQRGLADVKKIKATSVAAYQAEQEELRELRAQSARCESHIRDVVAHYEGLIARMNSSQATQRTMTAALHGTASA